MTILFNLSYNTVYGEEIMLNIISGEKTQDATATLPFSSAKKYGGVSFHAEETCCHAVHR